MEMDKFRIDTNYLLNKLKRKFVKDLFDGYELLDLTIMPIDPREI